MHDSLCAEEGGVYARFEAMSRACGWKGAVNSAISRFSGGEYELLITPCHPTNATKRANLVNSEASSLWRSSEWGVRGLHESFTRIRKMVKDYLCYCV